MDDGAAVNGTVDLGVIEWSPIQYGAYLWQVRIAYARTTDTYVWQVRIGITSLYLCVGGEILFSLF